jgi:hypothetical protein
MIQQDSFTVFENPVDSVRVSAENITSEQVTNLLNWRESLQALWNLVHLEYIVFVLVTYYIVVTRVQFIKTNSTGRRNLIMLILTVVWGIAEHFWRGNAILNIIVTGLLVQFCWEFLFKWAFRGLEKIGWTPLPAWHVEEIRAEKQRDVVRAESVQKPVSAPVDTGENSGMGFSEGGEVPKKP